MSDLPSSQSIKERIAALRLEEANTPSSSGNSRGGKPNLPPPPAQQRTGPAKPRPTAHTAQQRPQQPALPQPGPSSTTTTNSSKAGIHTRRSRAPHSMHPSGAQTLPRGAKPRPPIPAPRQNAAPPRQPPRSSPSPSPPPSRPIPPRSSPSPSPPPSRPIPPHPQTQHQPHRQANTHVPERGAGSPPPSVAVTSPPPLSRTRSHAVSTTSASVTAPTQRPASTAFSIANHRHQQQTPQGTATANNNTSSLRKPLPPPVNRRQTPANPPPQDSSTQRSPRGSNTPHPHQGNSSTNNIHVRRRSNDLSRSMPAVLTKQHTAPSTMQTKQQQQQRQSAEGDRFVPFEYNASDTDSDDTVSAAFDGKATNDEIGEMTAEEKQHKEEIVRYYAGPTPQQHHAATTIQKNVRRRICMKRLSKMKKNNEHRANVAKEILSTEETYIRSLRSLRETYLLPMKEEAKKSNGFVTKAHVTSIFSDIEVIVNVNDHFYTELAKRVENFSSTRTILSDIFLIIAPFFKSYSRYCNNYDNALLVLKELRKNEDFRTWVASMDKASAKTKLGITSYLILPIQRVPRYRLLLEDLVKHTDDGHPDKAGLQEAVNKIKDVATHLNVAMKVLESTQDIIRIQEQFTSDVALVEPHRRFIKEGWLTNMMDGTRLFLHLFNDILVHSTKAKISFSNMSTSKLEYKDSVNLYNVDLFNTRDSDDLDFQIKSPNITLQLRVSSIDEKNSWLVALAKAIKSSIAIRIQSNKSAVETKAVMDESSTTFALAMSSDQKSLNLSDEFCVRTMCKGAVLLKYCRNAKPHFRRFTVSPDLKRLTWGSPNKSKGDSQVLFKDIKKILTGQKTQIFTRYKSPDLESVSFSLLYKDRSLDIACKDNKEFVIWVQGLSFLLSGGAQKFAAMGIDISKQANDTKTANEDQVSDLRTEKKNFKEKFERIGDGYSWGQNTRGALGHGDEKDVYEPLVMKEFLYLDVDSMECENNAASAVMVGGEVFTWGQGNHGRLGHGDENDRMTPTFVKAFQGIKIRKVSMGNDFTLAMSEEGTVYAFGANSKMQLGLGPKGPKDKQMLPMVIESLNRMRIIDIETGNNHSAAITEDGRLLTWGRCEDGELGHNDTGNRDEPTLITTLTDHRIIAVSLGLWHSLALSDSGLLFSWGNATYGQLGHGTTEQVLYPKQVMALANSKIVQVAAGSTHSACLTNKGELFVWGNGIYGQIGNGQKEHSFVPCKVSFRNDLVKQIACGANHTMALTSRGFTYSWGAGTYGRLGLRSESDQSIPQKIPLLADKIVRSIGAGGSMSVAVCAHQWVPDKDSPHCMACRSKFTFTFRRHHCRNCGGLFCGPCTKNRIILLRFGFNDPVRVCDTCHRILKDTSYANNKG